MITKNIVKSKNLKFSLGAIYLIILLSFLYLFFSHFSLEEVTSYDFIQSNREYFLDLRQHNIIILSIAFFSFTILWILLGGFASPIALFAGFVFGKWLGCLLALLSLTFGATILYIIGIFFLKDIIKKTFSKKFIYLEKKFRNKALLIMIVYRIAALVPFGIANLLPVLFNIKIREYFFGTLIGIFPSILIMTFLGSGIESVIDVNDEVPNIFSFIILPEIYLPIIIFVAMVILSFLVKNFFNK